MKENLHNQLIKEENLHFNNQWHPHISSKNNEETWVFDLDLLIISYESRAWYPMKNELKEKVTI